jgi:hypothetical protein
MQAALSKALTRMHAMRVRLFVLDACTVAAEALHRAGLHWSSN